MKIKVYAIGDRLEKFYLEAIKEYEKRLSRYCNIKLVHLKKEEHLQKKISPNSFVIIISTVGKTISSEELATTIDQWASSGLSDVSLVIGANQPTYNETMTLSQMEMDFGLTTSILFEQVYRAFRIINNHPYHK
ncbi:23S rRNA (pseudouridine(1915)-N(3))-methyltransferase RlmH [Paenibacillus sp. tmac-D7]|uniref:23S rRNA (pseudouridine(1915)-N(3))-methyltransferase RlmH n=1 Tax=Paenibacillus sp. tmac-D7 TaxID=2591462 RepID=UPI00114115DF|nr:23S rRNA (pseudouridine(1915)-N(3))-methyltransferase RlmH [Paenibacillus sp. tmac-D7]